MNTSGIFRLVWLVILTCAVRVGVCAELAGDSMVTERKLALDPHFRYELIGPDTNQTTPKAGYGLILILPGGDGSEAFLPFCKEMKKWGMPSDFIAAELIAPKWTTNQEIIWPTSFAKEQGMTHSTEAFVETVIDDVAKLHKINPRHIFTISWSSGGPAAYVVALSSKRVTGSFVAMSVFKPGLMPPLAGAKGRAFYLYHSPDDQVCPFFLAELARQTLGANGARVELKSYPGGHGWQPFTYYFDSVRTGIDWLSAQQTGK